MIFDIDEKPGTWVDFFESRISPTTNEIIYDDPKPGAARFLLRDPLPFFDKKRKERKKTHKLVLNSATKAMEQITIPEDVTSEEEEKESIEMWDYVIAGLENAFDASKKKIECTKENKMKLVRIPQVLRFLTRALQLLSDQKKVFYEETEKN